MARRRNTGRAEYEENDDMATKKTEKKEPAKEVAKRAAPPPAKFGEDELPEFMRGKAGKGTEHLDQSDFEMPRLQLLQGISEELEIYDGLKAGDFFHNLAEESLGQEVVVVPLSITKRYVLWRPRPPIDQGGILARADDAVHWQPANASFTVKIDKKGTQVVWKTARTVAESGLARWASYDPSDNQSPPAATLCYVAIVALPDHPALSPCAVLLQRSGVKVARKWMSKLNVSAAPMYGSRFIMSSATEQGPSGPYQTYRFSGDGFVKDAAEFDRYEKWFEQFEKTAINLDEIKGAGDDTTVGVSRADLKDEKAF